MPDITRHTPKETITITVGATEAGAEAIDYRFWSGAMMRIPAAFASAASFRFYLGKSATGTFVEWLPSNPNESNPVTVGPGKGVDIPQGLFPSHFLKIVNQAGAGDIELDPKG